MSVGDVERKELLYLVNLYDFFSINFNDKFMHRNILAMDVDMFIVRLGLDLFDIRPI